MIVLVGFMGAGKTSVGRLLAERLEGSFVDTDEIIEQRTGASVASIFSTSGEEAFRALESDVVAEVLSGDADVVALGGGALEDPATRAAVAACTVVHLDISFEEAMRRVGGDADRPLLAGDPGALHARRRPLYQEVAHRTVSTEDKTPLDVAAELHGLLGGETPPSRVSVTPPSRVSVALPGRDYDVVVGINLISRVKELIPKVEGADKAFVVTQPAVEEHAATVVSSLREVGLEVVARPIGEGERAKTLATAAELYDWLAEHEAHRRDLVVPVGGGVVGDLAGFVAATYNRGVPLINVPTTLLAQVDAAIGGKTGVNLARGKNLVGAFHHPLAVVCDVATLSTVPAPEFVSGLAEVAKYGFIAEPSLLDLLETRATELSPSAADLLAEIVTTCAAIKARIVAVDERDQGPRAHLNYGHTFAHAIEQASGFSGIRHGEAVALGMMCAAHLAHEMSLIDKALVDRHRRVLEVLGLPTSAKLDIAQLERAWRLDKKYRAGVRFVLLEGLGRPRAGIEAPRESLVRALEGMA